MGRTVDRFLFSSYLINYSVTTSKDFFSKIKEVVNEVKIKWGIINLGWNSKTPYQILNNNL